MSVELVLATDEEVIFGKGISSGWYNIDLYVSGFMVVGSYSDTCKVYQIYHEDNWVDGEHISRPRNN